jgi:hypothetical protein
METIYNCTHPKLKFEDGTLTGGRDTIDSMGADTLILLDKVWLPSRILDTGGEIKQVNQRVIYFPIVDMEAPREQELREFNLLIEIIRNDLFCGKSVHVQCIGGHGRTGLVIACYVGKYRGIKNPVKWVRENYCEEAVESWRQIEFISKFTGTRLFCSREKYFRSYSLVTVVQEKKRYDEWWEELLKQVDEMDKKVIEEVK